MSHFSLSHLADHELLRDLRSVLARDREITAALLAHLAEVDTRKLYLPAAYPSMHAWCVGELGLSEDAAFRRIRAARTAREFPALFGEIASGRLNLSTVLLLTPHLSPANAEDLIAAAALKTRSEVEHLLAARFPQPDVPTLVREVVGDARQLAPAPVADFVNPLPHNTPPIATPPPRVMPLAPERFALQLTVAQATHDKLRYAQALLGHAVPSGDLAQVLDRALDALIARLEQRKFAATARARPQRGAPSGRVIPAAVRREVWQRDGGRCTFVSAADRRCEARSRLEYDHATPLARGGETSVSGLRLRCRAHNQHAADQAFGAGFMQRKRDEAMERNSRRQPAALRPIAPPEPSASDTTAQDIAQALRHLGFRADAVRRGLALTSHLAQAPIEARLRAALSSLAPRCVRIPAPVCEPVRAGSAVNDLVPAASP